MQHLCMYECMKKGEKDMKPLLKFEELRIKKAQLNEEASVPDLTDGQILQNRMKFFLDEEDEIYEGYGRPRFWKMII